MEFEQKREPELNFERIDEILPQKKNEEKAENSGNVGKLEKQDFDAESNKKIEKQKFFLEALWDGDFQGALEMKKKI